MMRMRRTGALVALAIMCGAGASMAQDRTSTAELRRTIESRFDVLPLRDGLALRPKTPGAVRSVEVTDGAIAVDGAPVTGAELRARLGADADAILQLSYLSDAERRALFLPASPQPAPPAPPAVTAPPAPVVAPPAPEPPQPPRTRRSRSDRRNGDRVRIGGSVRVDADETLDGDVVAIGGAVTIEGEVQGDVVAVGGGVTLGPEAVVDGDVTAVGGPLHRAPTARVRGHVQEVSLGGMDFSRWTWRRNPFGLWWSSMVGSAFALVGTLVRVAVLCLFCALVVLFGRQYSERAGTLAASASLKAGLVGLLAQILFLPLLVITIVVLVMTIVGIPLILLVPFLVLGVAIAALVGFTGVAGKVGSLAASRFGWQDQNPYVVTIIGVVLLMLPVILSRLASLGGGMMFPLTLSLGIAGFVIEYLAWTIGLGAMALLRFGTKGDSRPGEPSPAV
jgi:hypothetical protein